MKRYIPIALSLMAVFVDFMWRSHGPDTAGKG